MELVRYHTVSLYADISEAGRIEEKHIMDLQEHDPTSAYYLHPITCVIL